MFAIDQTYKALAHRVLSLTVIASAMPLLLSCAQVDLPAARNLDIESPTLTKKREDAINEQPDSVIYLPLGSDVLVPETTSGDPLPNVDVGPFELRSETLAGALQLILADYEIPLAFETEEGLTRTITVANLRGPLPRVVERVCSLADLYCAFEDGLLVIKDTQTFTVTIPPIGGDGNDVLSSLSDGLQAITGESPITDSGTRSLIYTATNRTAKLAERYFQRLRANTALIIYEMYIWEVSLDSANSTGIDWEKIDTFGKFNVGVTVPGGATLTDVTPVSIGLPTSGNVAFDSNDVLEFISTYGAVKTISQPQITVLSGGEASLRVAQTRNFISSLSQSVDNGETTVSSETGTVDSGFELSIASAWDNATVYGTVELTIQAFQGFEPFDFPTSGGGSIQLQLPETSENQLTTQVRIRPGDSLLIAGLVESRDQFNKSGPGFREPFFPTSRDASVDNSELVILMKPRVIVYTADNVRAKEKEIRDRLIEPNPDVFGGSSSSGSNSPVFSSRNKSFPQGTLSIDMLDPSR